MTPHGRNDVTRSVHDHSVGRYLDAIGTTINPDFESEADRALLERFALDVVGRTRGPVLDVGCGPERVAARLAEFDIDDEVCRPPVFAHETTDQAFPRVRAGRRRSRHRRGVGDR